MCICILCHSDYFVIPKLTEDNKEDEKEKEKAKENEKEEKEKEKEIAGLKEEKLNQKNDASN